MNTAHTATAAGHGTRSSTVEIHAVLDQPVTITARGPLRGVVRPAGGTICGVEAAKLTEPSGMLFPYEVTCADCYLACRVEGVEWAPEVAA